MTALAYARVDGVSPLQGRQVVGWNGYAPQIQGQGYPTSRMQIESNGAIMAATGAVGNPATSADDVVVDGQIITGENVDSGYRLGQVLVEQIRAQQASAPLPTPAPTSEPTSEPVLAHTLAPVPAQSPTPTAAPPLPVLMVIANRDFYYREYAVPRAELMTAGLQVRVAAQTTQLSYPHPDSGQGQTSGAVRPDFALSQVRSEDYSAILFVGGWGSSAYQYAPPGVYTNSNYNGSSPLAGRRATGGPFLPPMFNGPQQYNTSWYISANQGIAVPSRSIGNIYTAADDVIVDGRMIVARLWPVTYRIPKHDRKTCKSFVRESR